jgi:hypothetical protein
VLLHNATTIDLRNEIAADINGDIYAWAQRKPLTYHDVMFQTPAVLTLWPVEAPAPRVTLDQLPAAWTLLETVAWIMLRDPAVVRDTAPETARPGAEYVVKHCLPDGTHRATRETGPGGNSVRRLDLQVAWTRDRDPAAEACASTVAEDALLAALRLGRLTANAAAHPMMPADWRGLRLVEHDHDGLRPERTADATQPWPSVTLDRDAVVAIWSPLPATTDTRAETGSEDPFVLARKAMLAFAEKTIAETGKPARREDAAYQAASASGLAFRKMLSLYRELPEHLRNLPPAPGIKRK